MQGTMKAVIKTKAQAGAEYVETKIPEIKPDEVLVKVLATSICGTDVHIYKWDDWSKGRIGEKKLPQIMGHEVAGEVVEAGGSVRAVKVGDYVSAETHIPCNACIQCLTGQQHICANLKILGVDCNGAFAEYIAVPEVVCWINDRKIPPEFASVQEPLGNALYAVMGEDNDVGGRTMAIIGDGPIALLAAGVARAVGVTSIFFVGKYDFNMDIARKMGADHLLYANKEGVDRVAFVKDHTYGYGADIVLDMAGSDQALSEGFRMLRKGGRFSAFGIAASSPTTVDYNNGLVFKGSQIHGINGRKMYDTWFRVRNLLASGRLDISPVVTHMFPLSEFAGGFDAMTTRPRRSAKVILFPAKKEYEAACKRRGI
jgi:threonine 3-dehydrogenase